MVGALWKSACSSEQGAAMSGASSPSTSRIPPQTSIPSRPPLAPMPLSCWTPGSWTSLLVVTGLSWKISLSQVSTRPSFLLLSPTGLSLVLTSFFSRCDLFLFFCFISLLRILFVIVRLHCLAIRIDPVLLLVHQTPKSTLD